VFLGWIHLIPKILQFQKLRGVFGCGWIKYYSKFSKHFRSQICSSCGTKAPPPACAQPKSGFEFVPRDTEGFKFNQNLNSNLYREIPRNLSLSILTSWLKSPHHSGFRYAFRRAFRVSFSRERAVARCFWMRRLCCRPPKASTPGLSPPERLGLNNMTSQPRGWRLSKNGIRQKRFFGTRPAKKPSPGRMAQTPRADTGDSVGPFRCHRCSTLFNYKWNLSLCGTFLQRLLPLLDDCRLLPTPQETYDLNLSAVTRRISSFRISASIFGTKELYNPGLLPSPLSTMVWRNPLP